jgi:hypothetical protein
MWRMSSTFCRQVRPRGHTWSAQFSSKSSKKVTFEGSLGQHLIDIKTRHQDMTNELSTSDKLEVNDIIRISKDCAELSRVVVLIDQRKELMLEMTELMNLEKEELRR